MGMEQTVSFAGAVTPPWPVVRDFLERRGMPVLVRMVDGELAFPDELPPESWRELRLGCSQGMVTVRREQDRVVLVTWGNADPALRQAWNALAWAFAEVGNGMIHSETASLTAGEFHQKADLPPGMTA